MAKQITHELWAMTSCEEASLDRLQRTSVFPCPSGGNHEVNKGKVEVVKGR